MNKEIMRLALLGASKCDLSCSYCYLGQNCTFSNQDQKIINAWISGEYLQNAKKVLKIFNSPIEKVIDFQLWGGEPTLHMRELQQAGCGTQIGQSFPYLRNFLMPTNFANTDIEALIDFISDIDKELVPRSTDNDYIEYFKYHIQASIDGPPGDFNTYGHKVVWDKYYENYDKLFQYLATKDPFQNTMILLEICPCSTQKLILKNLNTYEQIKEFRQYYDEFAEYLRKNAQKLDHIIQIRTTTTGFYPRIAIPENTTSEEAMDINKMIRLFDICEYQENAYVIDKTDNPNFYNNCSAITNYVYRNHECTESNEYSLTLMPDGTIAQCPCLFFQDIPEFKNEYLEKKDYWEYKSTLIRANCFYNPLKDLGSKREKDREWYVYNGGYIGTHSTYINLNFNMAREMAISRQIDPNYIINQELLLDHYLANCQTTECFRENVNVYHNFYITDINQFRRWFNGTSELAYNTHKTRSLKILEKECEINGL